MIWLWINRIRAARWWGEALQLTSKSQYKEALNYVRRIEGTKSTPEGTKNRVYERLLKGYLLGALRRDEEALTTLTEFRRDLERFESTSPEVAYLRCYAAVVGADILGSAGYTPHPGAETGLFPVNYDRIELDKVPQGVKRIFPLRFHPRWKEVRRL